MERGRVQQPVMQESPPFVQRVWEGENIPKGCVVVQQDPGCPGAGALRIEEGGLQVGRWPEFCKADPW